MLSKAGNQQIERNLASNRLNLSPLTLTKGVTSLSPQFILRITSPSWATLDSWFGRTVIYLSAAPA